MKRWNNLLPNDEFERARRIEKIKLRAVTITWICLFAALIYYGCQKDGKPKQETLPAIHEVERTNTLSSLR